MKYAIGVTQMTNLRYSGESMDDICNLSYMGESMDDIFEKRLWWIYGWYSDTFVNWGKLMDLVKTYINWDR